MIRCEESIVTSQQSVVRSAYYLIYTLSTHTGFRCRVCLLLITCLLLTAFCLLLATYYFGGMDFGGMGGEGSDGEKSTLYRKEEDVPVGHICAAFLLSTCSLRNEANFPVGHIVTATARLLSHIREESIFPSSVQRVRRSLKVIQRGARLDLR